VFFSGSKELSPRPAELDECWFSCKRWPALTGKAGRVAGFCLGGFWMGSGKANSRFRRRTRRGCNTSGPALRRMQPGRNHRGIVRGGKPHGATETLRSHVRSIRVAIFHQINPNANHPAILRHNGPSQTLFALRQVTVDQ
jgi:hypothetical protein